MSKKWVESLTKTENFHFFFDSFFVLFEEDMEYVKPPQKTVCNALDTAIWKVSYRVTIENLGAKFGYYLRY